MNDTIITVVGNLVDRPTRRVLDSGASVTNFRVASTSRRYDRESQQWIDRDTLFVKVTCWRRMADNVARSLVQGDPVAVTGRCYTRFYESGGVTKMSFEMEASGIGPDLNFGQADFSRMRRDKPASGVVEDPFGAATAGLPPEGVVGAIDEEEDFEHLTEPEPDEPELVESGIG